MAGSMGASCGWVEGLSESQEMALAALRAGGTFAKAAEAAGVNRTTVYRWVQCNNRGDVARIRGLGGFATR